MGMNSLSKSVELHNKYYRMKESLVGYDSLTSMVAHEQDFNPAGLYWLLTILGDRLREQLDEMGEIIEELYPSTRR